MRRGEREWGKEEGRTGRKRRGKRTTEESKKKKK